VAARRELTFLLAEPERWLLRAIAARLPPWMTSDGLTVLGMVGALGTGVAYALSTLSAAWLWAASALLVVNWFGDSLDGTLARVRRAERPRYGYYLDHVVDAFSTAAIGAGIGLSPYVDLGVALAGVLAYLILSINIYLESQAFGVFRLGYSRIGPTEARIVLVAANIALALSGPGAAVAPIATGAAVALVVGMFVMVAVRIGRNLSALSRLEPPPPPLSPYRRTAFTAASASTYPAPTSHRANPGSGRAVCVRTDAI
jgi:archaetidylinositol phosphate synthase